MPIPDPKPGLVISYAYLWLNESVKGRVEGSKDRPCAMLLSVEREEGNTEVMVLPITHLPPSHASWGVEIPEQTRIRLGLDHQPSWVITTELNRFNWPGPDIRRVSRASDAGWDYGMLPPKLFEQIRQQVLANNKDKKLKEVERTE